MTVATQHHCRFCKTSLKTVFLNLGETPLANSYLTQAQLNLPEPKYPLFVHVCDECLLLQAQPVVSAAHIFSDYAYFSSYSSSWLEHAKNYSGMMTEKLKLGANSFVVEIASNDGYLLKNFVEAHIPCLGIEPAANVAAVAVANKVPTEVRFFGEATAAELVTQYGQADLMAANNVMAHVPDLNDFIKGFKVMLKPTGTMTVEFPHVLRLINEIQFDTIYHEHYSYFSLVALERIFKYHGLTIFDVETLPTHGGSLRIYAGHNDVASTVRMEAVRAAEAAAGLHTLAGYTGFTARVKTVTDGLMAFLKDAKAQGKKVAAYGAAAKGNTLLNVCGADTDLIGYVIDKNPHKQNHYMPGSHIPIMAPDTLARTKPDYVLVLPWNLIDEIKSEWQSITAWGGRFVTAIPQLKIWG